MEDGKKIITPLAKQKAMARILTAVCEVYGGGVCIHEQLMERNRYRSFVEPRQVGHYLSLTKLEGITSGEVGAYWLRDHSTVLCSRDHIQELLAAPTDEGRNLREKVRLVSERIIQLRVDNDKTTMEHYYTAWHNAHGLAEWK